MKRIALALLFLSVTAAVAQSTGGGGRGGAVTKIVAGANVTISPPSGVGAVTVNASGGGSFTAAGDLSGNSTSQTVIGINDTVLSTLGNGPYYFTAGVPALETAAQAIAALGSTPAINCSDCTNLPAPASIAGGAANDIPYQTGAGATGFISPVDNAVLCTSAGGVPSECTTLPSGIALVAPALGTPVSGLISNLTGQCTNCTSNNSIQWGGIAISGTPTNGQVPIASGPTTGAWGNVPTFSTGATYLSQQCGNSANCYQIYGDAKTSETAAWTAYSSSGGSATTVVTSHDNDSFGQYYVAGSPGSGSAIMTFAANTTSWMNQIAAFVASGTPTMGTCWGANDSAGSAGTITVSISPTGGSGHVLVMWARGSHALPDTITFSDNGGLGNVHTNINPYGQALAMGTGTPTVGQMGYIPNVGGGSYTLTATFSSSSTSRSIYACEISGLASSNVLDTSGQFSTGTIATAISTANTPSAGITTTQTGDLIFEAATLPSTSATLSSGVYGPTATVTNSDISWTSGDVGKQFIGTSGCDTSNGYQNCAEYFPPGGVITTYNSAHSIGVSVVPTATNSSSSGFTGWFVYCHDDGPTIVTAWANALANTSGQLALPANSMCMSEAPFQSASTGFLYNPAIKGVSQSTSVLIPLESFNYATASNALIYNYPSNNYSGFGSLFQNPFLWGELENFSIWGAGQDGSAVYSGLPMILANNLQITNVGITGWLWNTQSGANTVPAISGAGMIVDNFTNWASGSGGLKITGNGATTFTQNQISNCFFGAQSFAVALNSSAGYGVQISGGNVVTKSCQFLESRVSTASTAGNVTGGFWTSVGDTIGSLNVSGGVVRLIGSATNYFNSPGITVAGGAVSAVGTQIDKFSMSSGSFNDQGGNFGCTTIALVICSGATYPWTSSGNRGLSITGGVFLGIGSTSGIAAATSNIVYANFGTSPSTASFSGNNSPILFTITNGTGSITGTSTITYTYPVPYAVAPLWCTATQVGGTNTTLTFTAGTPTTTAVVFTASANPTASDTEIMQVSCAHIE